MYGTTVIFITLGLANECVVIKPSSAAGALESIFNIVDAEIGKGVRFVVRRAASGADFAHTARVEELHVMHFFAVETSPLCQGRENEGSELIDTVKLIQ